MIKAHIMANTKKTNQFSSFIQNEIWTHHGIHQGKKLKDLPLNYLKWGLEKFRTNSPQSTMIQMELSRRLGI